MCFCRSHVCRSDLSAKFATFCYAIARRSRGQRVPASITPTVARRDWANRVLNEMPMPMIQEVLHRVRAEFMEMPGLRLKAEQVQRLCGVERMICRRVLDVLLDEKFLCVNADGQ